MAETKTKSKAAAAKAETDGAARTIEWQGQTIALPAEMPDAILMDLGLVQASDDASASFQMLMTLIGEDQYKQVRNLLRKGTIALSEVADLIRLVFEEYGTTEGESEASQDS